MMFANQHSMCAQEALSVDEVVGTCIHSPGPQDLAKLGAFSQQHGGSELYVRCYHEERAAPVSMFTIEHC